MKKDPTRDYTTAAFRSFSALGMTYEQAKESVYHAEIEKWSHLNPSIAVIQAQKAVQQSGPMLLDILSVEKTLEILERGGKPYIVDAVKAVYFFRPTAPLRKGEISLRVRRFALSVPTDERTVYRWLREARMMCAAVRGLNISAEEKEKYHIKL